VLREFFAKDAQDGLFDCQVGFRDEVSPPLCSRVLAGAEAIESDGTRLLRAKTCDFFSRPACGGDR